ncbi:MAG: nitroreductase family protein [Lachnospiraceae bacterium]|nr:nitroreductase family protein [Lachnospiraceae bacterium]
MTNYEAVFNRCSVRKYKMELIPADFFKKLNKFLEGLSPLYPDIDWKFVLFNAMDDEGSTKGLFRVKAPYYLVCFTENDKNAWKQAGYLTEQVVLYLTAHGIGTCYQGGARAVLDEAPEGMGQRIVVAFGYPEGDLYRESGNAKRHNITDICIFKEEPTAEMSRLLAAARLAPSSVNSQPWRFVVYRNRVHIFARDNLITKLPITREMRDVDMGIVLYHMALTAEELWLDAGLVYQEQLAGRSVRGNTYVMSMMFQS